MVEKKSFFLFFLLVLGVFFNIFLPFRLAALFFSSFFWPFGSFSLGGDGFRGAILVLGSCFPFGSFWPCVFSWLFIRVQDDELV